MAKLFKNPLTGEEKTAIEWAMKLDHSGAVAFRAYHNKWIKKDEPHIAFADKKIRTSLGRNNQYSNRSILYHNQFAMEWASSLAWACRLGIERNSFLFRVRRHGIESKSTWLTKEEALALKGAAISRGKLSSFGKSKSKKKRTKPKDIRVGTLERKYLL